MATHDQDATDISQTIPTDSSDAPLAEDDLKVVTGGLASTGVGGDSGVCVAN